MPVLPVLRYVFTCLLRYSSGGGGWYTIYVLHRRGVPYFSWGCYRSFMLSMCSVEKQLVLRPRVLVGGLTSPLSDVVVENIRLRQKGDPFGHHHGVGDRLPSFSREFSPLFQLFYQSGKGFRGVIGPHHLHCILLEVDFVNHPVSGEKVSKHGECGLLYKPCYLVHQWGKED